MIGYYPTKKSKRDRRPRRSFHRHIGLLAFLSLLFLGAVLYYFLNQHLIKADYLASAPSDDTVARESSTLPLKINSVTKPQPKVAPTNPPAPLTVDSEVNAQPASGTFADVSESIVLKGIMYMPKKPLAIINNSIWTEGERVGSFKILEIKKDFIRVASGGEEFVIRLKR